MKFLLSFYIPIHKLAVWLESSAHRRKVYKTARVVLPVLVAIGWLSTGKQDDLLTLLQLLASFSVPHLAAKNTKDNT